MKSRFAHATAFSALVLIAGSPASADAHPYHVSYAEVEHDREHDRLEISLRVSPEDLEKILEVRAGREVELETSSVPETRAVDKLIGSYLGERFGVRDPRGNWCPLRFAGKQVDAKAAWLYFEIAVPDRLVGYELKDAVFFDLQNHQVNTLVFTSGSRRRTFTFRPGAPIQPLRPQKKRKQ